MERARKFTSPETTKIKKNAVQSIPQNITRKKTVQFKSHCVTIIRKMENCATHHIYKQITHIPYAHAIIHMGVHMYMVIMNIELWEGGRFNKHTNPAGRWWWRSRSWQCNRSQSGSACRRWAAVRDVGRWKKLNNVHSPWGSAWLKNASTYEMTCRGSARDWVWVALGNTMH